MANDPGTESGPQAWDLGKEGEAQFTQLRAHIEYGQGFDVFFCGCDSPRVLAEVKRRLADAPPPEHEFESLTLETSEHLLLLADHLAAVHPPETGRKIVFASAPGPVEDLKAAWTRALVRLNERRNITIRDCPNAIILAGPPWLPWLAHDVAPDLWSVRTAIFTFHSPPQSPDGTALPEPDAWRTGLPMAHELEAPTYYEELAEALEASRRPGEQATRGRLLLRASAAWDIHGNHEAAIRTATHAGEAFAAVDDELMMATSKGYIADSLRQRGDTDEALRILREEVLPTFERLGDVQDRADVMGNIATLLLQRGEDDEALRIHREEQLPVYEKHGDMHRRALTMGFIANILQQQGETDEALRIHREEELPVYEQLGDTRSQAATVSRIADILWHRGETDEALRILREKVVPVMRQIGDAQSLTAAMGKIANILRQRGETDEALRIHIEERLPVAQEIGDIKSIADIRFSCANIRLARDGWENGEAQTICDELTESFALFKKLQHAVGIAFVGLLLDPLLARAGRHDEALDVRTQTAAAHEKLGMADELAEWREKQQQFRKGQDE